MMGIPYPIWKLNETVEVECIVEDPAKTSYYSDGVRQEAGDRCRLPLIDAQDLVRRGKAQIIEGSVKARTS